MLIMSFLANPFIAAMRKTKKLKTSFLRFQLSDALIVAVLLSFLLFLCFTYPSLLTTGNQYAALAIINTFNATNHTTSSPINASSVKPTITSPLLQNEASELEELNDKGNDLFDLGNYTEAIEYFDKALAIDPNYKYALNGKGLVLENLERYNEAIEYFDKALAIDPNYDLAREHKDKALRRLGNGT